MANVHMGWFGPWFARPNEQLVAGLSKGSHQSATSTGSLAQVYPSRVELLTIT